MLIQKVLLALVLATSTQIAQAKADYSRLDPDGVLDKDGILRRDDGSVARVWGNVAPVACQKKRMHLPTAREYAREAQTRGAKGILELDQITNGVPKGYYRVIAINPDGFRDEFYFSSQGYKPTNEGFPPFFWTSSKEGFHDKYHSYEFSLGWGDLGTFPGFDTEPLVRCLPNR